MQGAYEKFRAAVPLPHNFGPSEPYARLYYVDPTAASGADADVEYQETESGAVVNVWVSTWMSQGGAIVRSPGLRGSFSLDTGELLAGPEDVQDLLTAMAGMRLADLGVAVA